MLIESVGTSVVVGKLRGGSFSNIKDANIEKWYFFVSGFLVEFSALYLDSKGFGFFRENMLLVHGLSYMLLFAGIYFNKSSLGFKIIFLGIFLNFLVIMTNNGQMPVLGESMVKIGLLDDMISIREGHLITHTLINSNTVFKYLGDVMVLPKPYPKPKIFSIGDVFMAVGVFMYIQEIMIKKFKNEKNVQYMK